MQAPYLSLAAYDKAVRSLIARGEFERAIAEVALKAQAAKNEPLAYSRVYGSPSLDGLCDKLGESIAATLGLVPTAQPNESVANAIYVCTETVEAGGHARVIGDLIRADPGKRPHVVFTNLWERPRLFVEEFERLGATITVLPQATMFHKLKLLLGLFAAAPRSRLLLFNHHQDVVAVAGVAGSPQHERVFVHHCDYQFCLGPFLPGVTHVDLHTAGYHRCREMLRIDDNRYWPLTCSDSPTRHDGKFMQGGGLTTCCCAADHKFTGNYPFSYFDVIPELLRAVPGRHVHIGPLGEPSKQRLARRLSELDVAPERFVHIPGVPNLREALLELKVDLYLVSFPLGGSRALIEAMSAGVPAIGHVHHRDTMLGAVDLLPDDAPTWTDPQELLSTIKSLDNARLLALSRSSRRRYAEQHAPQLLADCVAQGRLIASPPRRCPDVEPLQTVLFERGFVVDPPVASNTFVGLQHRHNLVQGSGKYR